MADVAAEPGVGTTGGWFSAKQKKAIGKLLKPWGKSPTSSTFWIQLITTAVALILSVAKAAENLANPTFVTFVVVGGLFCCILLYGYMIQKAAEKKEADEIRHSKLRTMPSATLDEEEEEAAAADETRAAAAAVV